MIQLIISATLLISTTATPSSSTSSPPAAIDWRTTGHTCGVIESQGGAGGFLTKSWAYASAEAAFCSIADTKTKPPAPNCTGVAAAQSGHFTPPPCDVAATPRTITSGNETALLELLQDGPVAAAIVADAPGFEMYVGGVLTAKGCGESKVVDHAVLVVGAGTMEGTGETSTKDYWVLQNDWGAAWGMKGYLLLERGVNACGIALDAAQPHAAAAPIMN
jgi:hypothetical protein